MDRKRQLYTGRRSQLRPAQSVTSRWNWRLVIGIAAGVSTAGFVIATLEETLGPTLSIIAGIVTGICFCLAILTQP